MKMRLLICGNGNLTRKQGQLYAHTEICHFLQECVDTNISVGYATIILDDEEEITKNLANSSFPENVIIEHFYSFFRLNVGLKFLYIPCVLLKLIKIIIKYDFFYCSYPGTISSLIIKFSRFFHKKYALYVRGNLLNLPYVRDDINKASFIFATGITLIKEICPNYLRCREVAPMSAVFSKACATAPRTDFHQPLRGLFVGRVEAPKGVYELLDALKILKEHGIPVTMNFVGTYPMDFARKVQTMDLTDRVILSGLTRSNEELEKHYEEADFFCLPTWTEGFPRVLYEAMSHALPCVTTMVGGIPSRMQDGANCVALKVKDADSIVAAIMSLHNDPKNMARLSEASLTTFRYWQEFFAGQTHAKQLYAAIAKLDHNP